jgi:hypothetical protein
LDGKTSLISIFIGFPKINLRKMIFFSWMLTRAPPTAGGCRVLQIAAAAAMAAVVKAKYFDQLSLLNNLNGQKSLVRP